MPGPEPDWVAAMRAAMGHAIAYREGLPTRPVAPQMTAGQATERLGGALNDVGRRGVEVINDMVAAADPGLLQIASPGFFAYVGGASHPVGVAADLLCSAWGQCSSYASATPSTVAMENAVCGWVVDLLGLPAGSGAGIVSGATMANMAAVMAARNALLRRANWGVEARGLYGAPEIQVVIGAEAHSATAAALRYAGLGADRVHRVAVDDQGRVLVGDFAAVMAGLSGPILVILQAGHINSGAFDRFAELMPIARAKRARGVPSYAILRNLGRQGVRDMIAQHCRFAARVCSELGAVDGITVMNEAASNQVSFRCGEGESGDQMTRAVLSRVQAMGRVYPSHGAWRGRGIIRVSICAYSTTDEVISALIADVKDAWRQVEKQMKASTA